MLLTAELSVWTKKLNLVIVIYPEESFGIYFSFILVVMFFCMAHVYFDSTLTNFFSILSCVCNLINQDVVVHLNLLPFTLCFSRPDTPGGKETGAAKVSKNLI